MYIFVYFRTYDIKLYQQTSGGIFNWWFGFGIRNKMKNPKNSEAVLSESLSKVTQKMFIAEKP
jgi:membrane protein YqaA with SNARE-associated domain